MAIKTVITRGYGNGTYSGGIGELITRGYTSGVSGNKKRKIYDSFVSPLKMMGYVGRKPKVRQTNGI